MFDENAVSIEEVIKFQRDANKARGAAMVSMDGQAVIYAITDPNVSTPLHELAHVFEHYLTDAEKLAVKIGQALNNGMFKQAKNLQEDLKNTLQKVKPLIVH